jgi:membrane protease YdiL (CAAX protease family)
MVPVMFAVGVATGFNPNYFDVYPLNPTLRPQNAQISVPIFVVHSVLYIGYYFGWEFLFRGFLQHGLKESCGIANAILIQTLASTMLHFGHPPGEVFASIFAGIFWGLLAVRTRSILSGFLQHSLLGIVLDATLIFSGRSV